MHRFSPIESVFKGRHFDGEIIILCVRWYTSFKLSLRDLVIMMAERGISVRHTTILRWVQRYLPEFEKRWRRYARPVGGSWRPPCDDGGPVDCGTRCLTSFAITQQAEIQPISSYAEFAPEPFAEKDRKAVNLKREYSINQIEYCRNFIFQRHFPIHRIFEHSCEMGPFRLTADKVAHIFGVRVTKRLRGKLHSVLEKLDHGHHVLRVYCNDLVG